MNSFKRYLALVATAIICTASLPLGAMKRKDNPVTPRDEIEEKKYKITPKQIPQDQPKSEKLSGFLGEKFYEAMELIKKVGIILNTTYEKEKNTPIDELPETSLRQTIKKNNSSEDIFLQQLKTYFCPEAIQLFTSWCETTKDSEENDKLFENVINYVLEHENDGSFSIYDEIKTICDKEKIHYPTIEKFNETCTKQDPKKRYNAWGDYIEKTKFHSNAITIKNFPKFKKCIDETAQEMGVEIKSIYINNCTSTSVHGELKKLHFNISEILYNHYTDNEIKVTLQHECTHVKNNDRGSQISKIITSFLKSTSKENLLLLINDENSINLIQQNTTFISEFYSKTKELFADKGASDKKNTIHLITYFAKKFITQRELSNQEDPITFNSHILESSDHIPLKPRIISSAQKLSPQNISCSCNELKKQDNKYVVTTWFPARQEYINFAINTLSIIDLIKIFKKNSSINISKYLKKEINHNKCLNNLERAFTYAMEKNDFSTIQEIFKSDNRDILNSISDIDLNYGFEIAVISNFVNIIQEFFKPCNRDILNRISDDNINFSFQMVAINDNLTIVQEFLNNDIIMSILTQDDLKKAFDVAKTDEIKNEIKKYMIEEWFSCNIQ
jgi:hypothetical protein